MTWGSCPPPPRGPTSNSEVTFVVFSFAVTSTNDARLLTFPNFRTIGHMSAAARKRLIIIQAKYLMFPLSYKQMRHLPFIVRTITRRPVPTAGPGLATSPSAGRGPAEGPDHRGADKQPLGPPPRRHVSMWQPVSGLRWSGFGFGCSHPNIRAGLEHGSRVRAGGGGGA